MNIGSKLRMTVALFVFLFAALFPAKAGTDAGANSIASRTAEVEGIKLHYLTAGQGPAVILLHGYTQTSRMWRPIIPLLAEKFTVIAPDLPGIGDSEIPADGLDMKTAAIRIHALAKSLGVEKARVVGHDIGLMSGTSVLTVRLLKHWCADASGRILNTTGTISLPTKLIRFQKPIAWLIPRPMRVQDECARAGPILSPFSKQPKILQSFLRPS